jgi:hypothetical protein
MGKIKGGAPTAGAKPVPDYPRRREREAGLEPSGKTLKNLELTVTLSRGGTRRRATAPKGIGQEDVVKTQRTC